MEICDFYSVMKTIKEYISDSRALSQTDLLYEIFATFMEDEENSDYDFDNAQVCRWMNGQAAITPRISRYYQNREMEEVLTKDVMKNVLPLFYDSAMCVEKLHDLLMLDDSISGMVKAHISEGYPGLEPEIMASVTGRLIHFILQRKFVKHGSENELAIIEGRLSPSVATYIIGCEPPRPCRFFVGRQREIESIFASLTSHGKVFLHGFPGMGKSETAKAFARHYKKEYTNQIYIQYSGKLKKDIADLDFVNDPFDADEELLFEQHHRFLRTLREDSLLIVDNYSETDRPDPLLSEVLRYHCHVLFTTRNAVNTEESIYLDELAWDEQVALAQKLYTDIDADSYSLEHILSYVHGHTFAIELVSRLLNSGIMTPKELDERLFHDPASMAATDTITVSKDGKTIKATYAEHIRELFGLFNLSEKQLEVLGCAVLIPESGCSKRYFIHWLGHRNANIINELIDLGFLHESDNRRIFLHELIQDLIKAELNPSVNSCITMLKNIQHDCLMHGIDNPPYYHDMIDIIDRCILEIKNDNKKFFLRFLEDAFAYYDGKTGCPSLDFWIGDMEACMMEPGVGSIRDKVLILNYKACYESDHWHEEKALELEKQAASLITDVTAENALLYSNIHSNLAMMYFSRNDIDNARIHAEEGIRILEEFDLMYMHDTIPQACNFAQIQAVTGRMDAALEMLRKTEEYVRAGNGEISTDYAMIEETMGAITAAFGRERDARGHFRKVLEIYAEIYDYDMNELFQVATRLCEYFPDKESELGTLLDYNTDICDKRLSGI